MHQHQQKQRETSSHRCTICNSCRCATPAAVSCSSRFSVADGCSRRRCVGKSPGLRATVRTRAGDALCARHERGELESDLTEELVNLPAADRGGEREEGLGGEARGGVAKRGETNRVEAMAVGGSSSSLERVTLKMKMRYRDGVQMTSHIALTSRLRRRRGATHQHAFCTTRNAWDAKQANWWQ